MQYLRESRRSDLFLFDGLTQRKAISLGLGANAQFITLENKSSFNGLPDLRFVIGGNVNRVSRHAHRSLRDSHFHQSRSAGRAGR